MALKSGPPVFIGAPAAAAGPLGGCWLKAMFVGDVWAMRWGSCAYRVVFLAVARGRVIRSYHGEAEQVRFGAFTFALFT